MGFEVVTRAPIYAVMNNPVSSDSRLLRAWWRKLTRVLRARKAAGPALGAALYPLELTLVSRLKRAPSTELVVCRKAGNCTRAVLYRLARYLLWVDAGARTLMRRVVADLVPGRRR